VQCGISGLHPRRAFLPELTPDHVCLCVCMRVCVCVYVCACASVLVRVRYISVRVRNVSVRVRVGAGGAAVAAAVAAARAARPFRSAEQSTEMFRSLRSVAMQLDQGLAEMEELDSLDHEEDEAPPYDAPAMTGPASVEAEPQVRLSVLYIHAYIHAYIHTYIHACIHTCIYIRMHVCMYMYVHTYMYISVPLSRRWQAARVGLPRVVYI